MKPTLTEANLAIAKHATIFGQGAPLLRMISKSRLLWHDAGGMPNQRSN